MQRLAEDIKFFESYEYGAMLHGYKFEEGWLEAGTWIRDVWRSQSEHPMICYELDGSPYVDEEDVWYTFDASSDGVHWHCYSSHSRPK